MRRCAELRAARSLGSGSGKNNRTLTGHGTTRSAGIWRHRTCGRTLESLSVSCTIASTVSEAISGLRPRPGAIARSQRLRRPRTRSGHWVTVSGCERIEGAVECADSPSAKRRQCSRFHHLAVRRRRRTRLRLHTTTRCLDQRLPNLDHTSSYATLLYQRPNTPLRGISVDAAAVSAGMQVSSDAPCRHRRGRERELAPATSRVWRRLSGGSAAGVKAPIRLPIQGTGARGARGGSTRPGKLIMSNTT